MIFRHSFPWLRKQRPGALVFWIARLVLQRKEGRGPRRPAPTRRPACGPRAALSWRARAGQQRCGRLLACAAPLPLTCVLCSRHLTRLPGRTLQRPGLPPRPRPEKPSQRTRLRPALGRRGCRASSQPLYDTGARLARHLLPRFSARSSAHALREGRGQRRLLMDAGCAPAPARLFR